MKKILFTILCLSVIAIGSASAQTNSLTFSTYYPAPYGAYDRLRLVPTTVPPASPCEIGTLYVLQSGSTPNEISELKMCRNNGSGLGEWVPMVGVWTQSGNNIYPTDFNPATPLSPDLSVGIGTASPASKLHVSGSTGSADVLIEADTDGDQTGTPSLTLKQDGGLVVGKLYFDTFNLRLQAYHSSSSLHLGTGGLVRMVIDPDGDVGINDLSPDALFEISGNGLGASPYLMLSSNDDTDGDILNVDSAGHVLINSPVPNLNARLVLKAEGSDNAEIGFGGDGGANGAYDIMYNGGNDGDVRFVHTGAAGDSIIFSHYNLGTLTPLAQIRNDGLFYAADKISIGIAPTSVHSAVELHVHETDVAEDVTVVLSDAGTNTGFSDADFPYINSQTIGVLMPHQSLTAAGSASSLGGLQIVGLSDGDVTAAIPGLNLVGALGTTDPGDVPAVDISGFKLDGAGDIALLTNGDITMGVNLYSSISNSYFMVLADGKVGIGFQPFNANRPTQKLHVNGLMRLEPLDTPPSCPANGDENGSIYANSGGKLCFCHAGQWYDAAGTSGSCN